MKHRSTIFLLLAVLALGAYIAFFERRSETTEQRRAAARLALRLDPETVRRFSIVHGSLQVSVERADGRWRMTAPVQARADSDAVARLLDALAGLDRAGLISERDLAGGRARREDYGLAVPRARIVLERDPGSLTLLVGRDAPLGGNLYLQIEGRPDIVVAPTNLLEALPRSAADLRDRRLWTGYPSEVARIEARRRDGILHLSRGPGGGWRLQKPMAGRAGSAPVQNWLSSLYELRALDFVAESVTAAALYGLDEPVAQIALTDESGAREQTLAIGKAVESAPGQVYARLQNEGVVYALTNAVLDLLKVRLDDLRDHRLLDLAVEEIRWIEIAGTSTTLRVVSTNAAEWALTAPVAARADAGTVRQVLALWAGAQVGRYLDDVATNLAALGLASPALTMTFARRPPAPAAGLAATNREPVADAVVLAVSSLPPAADQIVVRLAGEDAAYAIPARVLADTPLAELAWRDRLVLNVATDAVRSLTIRQGEREETVERTATNLAAWTAAGTNVADVLQAADLVERLAALRAVALVAENPKDLAAFGLFAPSASLAIGLSGDAGVGKTLLLGAADGAGNTFALVKGKDLVFTLDDATRDKLLAPLYKQPATEKPANGGKDRSAKPGGP